LSIKLKGTNFFLIKKDRDSSTPALVHCVVPTWRNLAEKREPDCKGGMFMAKGTLIYRHRDPVQLAACVCVAWSPDGEGLAVGEVESRIHVYNATTKHHSILYQGDVHGTCASLDWSPDSTRIVAGYQDGTTIVWNVTTGEADWTFQDHEGFTYVGWCPDGTSVAYAGYEQNQASIYLRDVRDGTIKALYSLPEQWPLVSLAWSPQGRYLAAGGSRGDVYIWSPSTNTLLLSYRQTLTEDFNDVTALAWSSNERYLASGDTAKIVQVWDRQEHRPVARFLGKAVDGVRWMPGDTAIASAGGRAISIWEAATARTLATYQDPFYEDDRYIVSRVEWSPDRTQMASVGGYAIVLPEETRYEGFLFVWSYEQLANRNQEEQRFPDTTYNMDSQKAEQEDHVERRPLYLGGFINQLAAMGLTPKQAMDLLHVKSLHNLNYEEAFEKLKYLLKEEE
jgi:WD40 repeat protein